MLGGYHVVDTIAAGQLAQVHRARRAGSSDSFILKIACSDAGADAVRQEVRFLQRLGQPGHRGVIGLVEAETDLPRPWLVTPDIAAPSLREAWQPDRADARTSGVRVRSEERALRSLELVHSLAVTLDYIHSRDVVHADVCPANVLLAGMEGPVLIDFGSAVDGSSWEKSPFHQRDGTPGYVAPERLRGEPWDTRADIYSLGCLWFELCTGHSVFSGTDADHLVYQHLEAPPPSAAVWVPNIDPEIERSMLATLDKDPYARTPSARLIAELIEQRLGLSASKWASAGPRLFRSRTFGRERERAQLRSRLRAARAGQAGVTVLVGAAGTGKSRLLGHAEEEAKRLGFRVLRWPGEDSNADDASTRWAPVEELRDGEATVISIDDAHRYGERGLAALIAATRQRPDAVLSALILVWHEEMRLPSDLLAAGIERIPVAPLSGAATAAVVTDMLAERSVEPELSDAVYRQSRGNSAAIRECLFNLAHLSLLEHDVGCWRLQRQHLEQQQSSGVWLESTVARALALPLSSRTAVGVAAVLGEGFEELELQDLLQASAWSGDSIARVLDDLVRARFLVRVSSRRLRFVAHGYREALECLLDTNRRLEIHRRCVKGLLEHPPLPHVLRRLGRHYAALGEAQHSLRAFRRAARASAEQGAFVATLRDMEACWAQAKRLMLLEPARRDVHFRIGFALLEVLSRAAEHTALRELAAELLSLCEGRQSLLCARVHRICALSARVCGDSALALEHLQTGMQLLAVLQRRSRWAIDRELIRNRIAAAWTHYAGRDAGATSDVVRQVLPLARSTGTATQLAEVYMWRANAIALRRMYAYSARAVECERRALALHTKSNSSLRELTLFRFDLAFMLLLGGEQECREAAKLLDEAARTAPMLHDVTIASRVTTYRAIAYRRLGELEGCAELVERAIEQALECGQQGYVGAARACRSWVSLRRGDHAEAQRDARAALGLWQRSRTGGSSRHAEYPFQWLALMPLLSLAAAEERPELCLPLFDDLLHPTQARLSPPVRLAARRAQHQFSGCQALEQLASLERFLRRAVKYRYL